MKLIDILKKEIVGKKIKHKNQYRREVTLEVEDVICERHTVELEPATAANDWWPASSESVSFKIKFVDGSSINVDFSENLDLIL